MQALSSDAALCSPYTALRSPYTDSTVQPLHSRGSVLGSTDPRLYSRGSCFPMRTQKKKTTYEHMFARTFFTNMSRTHVREHMFANMPNIRTYVHSPAKVLGLRGVVIQSEASGQVGEVPAAEPWVWQPGAPFGRRILKLRSEPASTFHSLLGPLGLNM